MNDSANNPLYELLGFDVEQTRTDALDNELIFWNFGGGFHAVTIGKRILSETKIDTPDSLYIRMLEKQLIRSNLEIKRLWLDIKRLESNAKARHLRKVRKSK